MMFFKLWKHDLDYGLLRKMVFYVLSGLWSGVSVLPGLFFLDGGHVVDPGCG